MESIKNRMDEIKDDLFKAIQEENLQDVKNLLKTISKEKTIPHGIFSKDGTTVLHIAVEKQNENMISLLLNAAANIDGKDGQGQPVMNLAARTGNKWIVQTLLNKGAHVNVQDSLLITPLHLATLSGNNEVVRVLLRAGAKTDAMDENGYTPFHYSIKHGDLEQAKMFLIFGADPSIKNHSGFVTLHEACLCGAKDKIELLLDHPGQKKVNVNSYTNNNEYTPLYIAAGSQNPDVEAVKLLLSRGADPNAKVNLGEIGSSAKAWERDLKTTTTFWDYQVSSSSETGPTALHAACLRSNAEIVKLLLDYKADVHARDKCGATPFHWACHRSEFVPEILQVLLENGANPNDTDVNGVTPLFYAINKVDVTNFLLDHGADVNLKVSSKVGKVRLLDFYVANRNVEFAKVLLDRGACIDEMNEECSNPFSSAVQGEDMEMIKLLFAYGALKNTATLTTNNNT